MEKETVWYYVYVLYSLKDKKHYIGFTKNLKQRINAHNNGLNTSTCSRRPLIIIFAESFLSEKDARKREKFLKSGRGREVLKEILLDTIKDLSF